MKVVCITEALRPYIPVGIGDEVTVKEMFPAGMIYRDHRDGQVYRTKEDTCQLVEFPEHLAPMRCFVPIDEVPGEVVEVEEEIFA